MPEPRMISRSGDVRLGIGFKVRWFVFWTFTYVLGPHRSQSPLPQPVLPPLAAQIALVVAAATLGPWVVSGFRPDAGGRPKSR
jgi:hypothetical protein